MAMTRNYQECLDIHSTELGRISVPKEEELLQGIVIRAIEDYILCIKRGCFYKNGIMFVNGGRIQDCCVNIIRDVTKNDILAYYDICWERIFKEIDKQNEYWFVHYLGSDWVHPWNILYNDISSMDISKRI